MRLAMAIALGVMGILAATGRADEPLTQISLNSGVGYIVSESYGTAHQADFIGSFVQFVRKLEFWTPTPSECAGAERTLRELIHSGTSDPGLVFPSLERSETSPPDGDADAAIWAERNELTRVETNYNRDTRHVVGVILDGQKVLLCNFSDAPGVDPAKDYIFMQKTFEPKGVHFLQAKFDLETKKCTNVSLVGWWSERPAEK